MDGLGYSNLGLRNVGGGGGGGEHPGSDYQTSPLSRMASRDGRLIMPLVVDCWVGGSLAVQRSIGRAWVYAVTGHVIPAKFEFEFESGSRLRVSAMQCLYY